VQQLVRDLPTQEEHKLDGVNYELNRSKVEEMPEVVRSMSAQICVSKDAVAVDKKCHTARDDFIFVESARAL
jgi:hypothetical protein